MRGAVNPETRIQPGFESPPDPSGEGQGPSSFLMIRAGGRVWAIPLGEVVEVTRALPVEPVPGLPPWVRGFSIHRGGPLPVVDLWGRAGVNGSPGRAERRVVLRLGERRSAIAVDEVLGIRPLDPSVLEDLPPLAKAAPEEAVAAIGVLDRELLLVLESARLLPEDVWALAEARGERR